MTLRRLAAGPLAGLVALAVLVVAPSASALTRVSAPGQRAATYVGADVACPAGQRVVSGGFRGGRNSFAVVNAPISATTWRVRVSGTTTPDFRAFAYCTRSTTLRVSTVKVTARPDNDATKPMVLTPTCPVGKDVVAGGWAYDNSRGNSPVFASRPSSSRTWTVKAFRGAATTISGYAVCVAGGVLDLTVRQATGASVSSSQSGGAKVRCDSSEEFLSGGFSTKPAKDYFNSTGPDFFYRAARTIDSRTWKVDAINYSAMAGAATAYAVCRR